MDLVSAARSFCVAVKRTHTPERLFREYGMVCMVLYSYVVVPLIIKSLLLCNHTPYIL